MWLLFGGCVDERGEEGKGGFLCFLSEMIPRMALRENGGYAAYGNLLIYMLMFERTD